MSDPYRDGGYRDAVDAPQERGIVGDVIAQFADPHAFYRELVQNAIDAGSPDVDIELSYDDSAEKLHVEVRDRGEGMTRDIVENQLLVLFRSTKEKDGKKIGKFGVGFASVLSPNPEVVAVHTSRDGKRLTLHLYRDLTYELFDGGRATQTGTTIELELAIPRGEVAEFERLSHAALRRWCRHASVPIHVELGRGEQRKRIRIDEPLTIAHAIVTAHASRDNGQLTIVAGLTAKRERYLGLFNHGLMLHESEASPLGAVSVKIQDSRLGHTISRDDVRRDEHYSHAIEAARHVVATNLAANAETRLRELAEAGGTAEYAELLTALTDSEMKLGSWHFPLVEPVAGKRTVSSDDLSRRVWGSNGGNALTAALAAAGVPVVSTKQRMAVAAACERLGITLQDVNSGLTAVAPVERTGADEQLISAVAAYLSVAMRAVGVTLVEPTGSRDHMLAISLASQDERIVDDDDATRSPFPIFMRRVVALSAKHSAVAAARKADDPDLAASHIARAVLLQWGLLDAKRSRALLDVTLERLGVGS